MNNDNSSKLLLSQEHKNESDINKNNLNKEKNNGEAKIDFNFSDYFKLIKHKNNSYINIKKENKNKNYNYKLIPQKCCKYKNSCEKKQKINNKIDEINNITDLDLNHLNISESEKIFNKKINKEKKQKIKLPSTNNTSTTLKKTSIKKLIRNSSCKNFNNYILKKNYDIENNLEEKEESHDIGKYLVSSQKFFEKVKNNKCEYYNEKNNYYIDSRRQRIENNLNKKLLEEYNILKPLRMTERIFYKENNEKINNQRNEINISNNLFYSDYNKKNNVFKAINHFLFNESDNYNKCDKNLLSNKKIKMYYDKVKQISNSRKNLFTEDFFNDNKKKECDLFDFDFSFLYRK